ncbi:hypothetical protein GGR58DRAFT_501977 [Xylaria digitata]|nr:hypothetical protein GGR58DRAFT_501977 [Xylaria digitata]
MLCHGSVMDIPPLSCACASLMSMPPGLSGSEDDCQAGPGDYAATGTPPVARCSPGLQDLGDLRAVLQERSCVHAAALRLSPFSQVSTAQPRAVPLDLPTSTVPVPQSTLSSDGDSQIAAICPSSCPLEYCSPSIARCYIFTPRRYLEKPDCRD